MRIGPNAIRALLPLLDSNVFSADIYAQTGVFVIREVIPPDTLRLWQSAWETFAAELSARAIDRFNPAAVHEESPPILATMHREPALLDIVERVFGPDIALYHQRFVIKDHQSRGPIVVHQDFPYHFGWPVKASAFVALSNVTPENGGLTFHPGTHQWGHLGDAGEIDMQLFEDWPAICPSLEPGDVVLMSSSTFHGSGAHVRGCDRILADILYQPADDPSSIALLRGRWRTEIFMPVDRRSRIFRRSRTSRLRELQKRVDELESRRSDT